MRYCSEVLLLFALFVSATAQAQSTPRQTQTCAAAVCEEAVIYAVAIDSVLREMESRGWEGVRPPRILRTVHRSPFRFRGTLSPAVDHIVSLADAQLGWRLLPEATLVDSASIVESDGRTLIKGGVLFVLAPVTWLGPDAARVRLATHRIQIDHGVEQFVFLAYRDERWTVERIEHGLQS